MTAVFMADQKAAGGTLTPQASGPHVLLSRLLEHLSLDRQEKLEAQLKTEREGVKEAIIVIFSLVHDRDSRWEEMKPLKAI